MILNYAPSIKDVRSQGGRGVCQVRTFFGQRWPFGLSLFPA